MSVTVALLGGEGRHALAHPFDEGVAADLTERHVAAEAQRPLGG